MKQSNFRAKLIDKLKLSWVDALTVKKIDQFRLFLDISQV